MTEDRTTKRTEQDDEGMPPERRQRPLGRVVLPPWEQMPEREPLSAPPPQAAVRSDAPEAPEMPREPEAPETQRPLGKAVLPPWEREQEPPPAPAPGPGTAEEASALDALDASQPSTPSLSAESTDLPSTPQEVEPQGDAPQSADLTLPALDATPEPTAPASEVPLGTDSTTPTEQELIGQEPAGAESSDLEPSELEIPASQGEPSPEVSATLSHEQPLPGEKRISVGSTFRGGQVLRQLSSPPSNPDVEVFLIEMDGGQYILKVYAEGVEPEPEVLLKLSALSQAHPSRFVRMLQAAYDTGIKRWFELQEYVRRGTLRGLLDDRSRLTAEQREFLFDDVAREVGQTLAILHQNGLLYPDMTPSNILVRAYDPLTLILTDLDIVPSLPPEALKRSLERGLNVPGAPMYRAPECFAPNLFPDGVGQAADWWGLGMILLEIAAGGHPFRGMRDEDIKSDLLTYPVPIPGTLDEGQRELLHSLLTRDPVERWSWEQVARWLMGERGLSPYFEPAGHHGYGYSEGQAPESGATPLKFMGEDCSSLKELAHLIARDEASWAKGREFLTRGYVRQWMESNGEFDACVDLDALLDQTEDPDEKVCRFLCAFAPDLPFTFGGRPVTLQGLAELAEKSVEVLANGRLLACLNVYEQGRPPDGFPEAGEARRLRKVLQCLEGRSQADAARFLDACLHPEGYYCPFFQGASVSDPGAAAEVLLALQRPPLKMEDWEGIQPVVPSDVIVKMSSAISYDDALSPASLNRLLMLAAERNAPEAIRRLVHLGADVNAQDAEGRTALMAAEDKELEAATGALIECGADATIRPSRGSAWFSVREKLAEMFDRHKHTKNPSE